MKKLTIKNIIMATLAIGILSGCDDENTRAAIDATYVSGGTPQSPATMSLNRGNKIVENSFYNYFIYEAVDGEQLHLESILTRGITDSQRVECQESGDSFIVIYDADMTPLEQFRTCSSTMVNEFSVGGKYILQIKYPGNLGHFNASSEQ